MSDQPRNKGHVYHSRDLKALFRFIRMAANC